MTDTSLLFQPTRVGRFTVQHRVVHPSLTRFRTEGDGLPILPLVKDYYVQRSSVPGTLLLAEAMFVAPAINGFPALFTKEHVRRWREITDAVHAKGSYIYAQIAAAGRVSDPAVLARQTPPVPFTAPSPIAQPPGPFAFSDAVPREMTHDEIKVQLVQLAETARVAVEEAGFDGVELHACNGSLVEQFLKDVTNVREDEYGGSPERRARFGVEAVDAIVAAVGADHVGMRVSPWNVDPGMEMKEPEPTYTYFVSEVRKRHPSLAWLHAIEARVDRGGNDRNAGAHESIEFLRRIWAGPSSARVGTPVRQHWIGRRGARWSTMGW
ncbi:hypothetical protein HGRIS_007187 [Hohenbuehelia grisea]|uniref:NADH:flavin oxidoreductase/NADH oxidase N-terminal domain-containing protein n=1 Tax=Hohenbuehelia grisea TaxID=104357 RepID=A0ABR3JCH3_9AGAR